MIKFRTRLLIGLLTLIIAVLVGLGILLGQLFKSYYIDTYDGRLQKELNLLTIYIENSGGIGSIKSEDVMSISQSLNVRLAITNDKGFIIQDSDGMNQSGLNGLKENINEVIKEKLKKETKLVEHDEYDLHYSWKPIMKDGQREGFIFVITKTSELKKAYGQIWWILSISLGIALIAILFLGIRITARYTKPIEAATNVAIELAKGNYRARTEVRRTE